MKTFKKTIIAGVICVMTACKSQQIPSGQKVNGAPAEKVRSEQNANDAAAEQRVFSTVIVGMSREEVIQKMGKPTSEDRGSEGLMIMWYFEKSPPYPVEKEFGYGGFEVLLTKDNKVSRVTIIHQSVHRSQQQAPKK
jgi:hypothetical protein